MQTTRPWPVLAEKKPIEKDYCLRALKFATVLREQFKLTTAAEYLEQWVQGRLEQSPLLDVSASLGGKYSLLYCNVLIQTTSYGT